MEGESDGDAKALRDEVARLRAENEEWRGLFRVGSRSPDETGPVRPVRVVLLPDPLAARDPGLGPEALAGVARTAVSILEQRTPEVDWRAEHDLARVPDGALCHQLGDLLTTLWGLGAGVPMTFGIDRDERGKQLLRRRLVAGEPDSDQFCAGYDRQLDIANELLIEGQAAHGAGAEHHAVWTLKATDVVLARLSLSLAAFQAGRDDWHEALGARRPEYEPRHRVDAELPAGH